MRPRVVRPATCLNAAVIGIGAAWMLMSNRSGQSDERWSTGSYRSEGEISDRDRRLRDYTSDSNRENLENIGSEYGSDYSRSGYLRTRGAYGYGENRSSSGNGLLDRVRSHPVPAALAGIGLGWLAFANGDDEQRYAEERSYYDKYDRDHYSAQQNLDDRSTMSEVSEKVSDAASGVAQSAQEMSTRAQEYSRDAAQRARRAGRRAERA